MGGTTQFRVPKNVLGGGNVKPLPHTAPFIIPVEEFNPNIEGTISFSQFLLSSPLFGSEIQCSRDNSSGREIVMEQ